MTPMDDYVLVYAEPTAVGVSATATQSVSVLSTKPTTRRFWLRLPQRIARSGEFAVTICNFLLSRP